MSSRLTGAVAATLTIAALSLSLIVALNVLSANTPIGLAG
jgi:hypothetical protein